MAAERRQLEGAHLRPGFTLAEMLVAVLLVFALTGIVLIGSRAMEDSRNHSTAEQQMALLARAIDQYASFWPKWRVAGVVVAEKGWPDFIPGRLFETTTPTFEMITNFNDDVVFDVNDLDRAITDLSDVDGNDALSANLCLAYCLTADSGKGPYVPADDIALLIDIQDPDLRRAFQTFGRDVTDPLLPAYVGVSAARRAQVVVDPWGTPYRYFWVYRDTEQDPTQRAYKGFLPVDYGAFLPGPDDGGVNNPAMFQLDGTRKTAVGFVLESAGHDRRFGNVWKVDPSRLEIEDASDNLTVMP